MPPSEPRRIALDSTDAELDRAAQITPDDLALLAERAPAPVRDYLNAEPVAEGRDDAADA